MIDRLVICDGPLFRVFWSCTGSTFGSASVTWCMNPVLFLHKHILLGFGHMPKKLQVHDMTLFEVFGDV
jgi:hypothetical protein